MTYPYLIDPAEIEPFLAEKRRYSTWGTSFDNTDEKEREKAAEWLADQFNAFLDFQRAVAVGK